MPALRACLNSRLLPPLVALLGAESEETQAHAGGALLHIAAASAETRTAVVCHHSMRDSYRIHEPMTSPPSGGRSNPQVGPLVALLASGTSEAKAFALWTLAALADGKAAPQGAILEAGGVPKIASCLRGGDAPMQAAAAKLGRAAADPPHLLRPHETTLITTLDLISSKIRPVRGSVHENQVNTFRRRCLFDGEIRIPLVRN